MVSPSQDLIGKLNDAMHDPMSENISTKYYESTEVSFGCHFLRQMSSQ